MTTDAASPVRLFVAAGLPADALAAVREWQRSELGGRPDLRVTQALHVTLCFLGDTPAEAVSDIAAALAGVPVGDLEVELGDVIFLPRRGRKSVVALRVEDPSGGLVRIQADMSARLIDLRVLRPEARPYLPHLTVARYRRPGHPFPLQNVNFRRLCLPSVILYSSKLEKGGAVHTPLATFPAT